MPSKLSAKIRCYKILHVSLLITTKEKPVIAPEKMMIKESKHTAAKSHQITKEVSKGKQGTKDLPKSHENVQNSIIH